jgi:uncharacterized protein YdhG (YjbR/CyaY superfamily)
MPMSTKKFLSVNEYLASVPGDKKPLLKELRNIIRKAAPEAEEVISYNMPAYKQNGILVYFMAHRNHIGFYPGSKVISELPKDKLRDFKTSKGTIQLPFNKPLPKRLIQSIVKMRVKQNIEKRKLKNTVMKKGKR